VNMNSAGGHWAPNAEVEGWAVLDEAEEQPKKTSETTE
jgi:hypothetical protein